VSDVVTKQNEELYRRAFAIAHGHTEECILETVNDMAILLAKACDAYNVPLVDILDHLTIEQFDLHLRNILDNKDCTCNNRQ